MTTAPLTVPAAEANRRFSALLRAARGGARIIITSHGEPVAVLGPALVASEAEATSRMADLEAHWSGIAPIVVGRWSREDLYDRGFG